MIGTHSLTMNQKRVIVGLCLYPIDSDYEIARKLSVKRSTFSTIKKELISSLAIRPVNIPNFLSLKAEVIALEYFHLNPVILARLMKNQPSSLQERIQHFPNIVSSTIDTHGGFSLLISKSLTDVTLAHKTLAGFCYESGLSNPHNFHLYTAPSTEQGVINFMEYGKQLASVWGILIEEKDSTSPLLCSSEDVIDQISPVGWKIFNNLINNPSKSIIELTEIVGKPRNTIARWVQFFLRNKLYFTRYIPKLVMLGMKIQVVYFISIKGLNDKDRKHLIESVQYNMKPFNLFVSHREIVIISVSKDYSSFRKDENAFIKTIRNTTNTPYQIKDRIVTSTGNLSLVKDFHRSLNPLLEYLKASERYNLKPFNKNTVIKNSI